MARPRKTTGKTAFGKRTSAEKSFRTRRKAKPEDCDDKAKKPVDITPDSISLSGTPGCSLDEAHP